MGIIDEEETIRFLEMTDDRNMTSHTYKEELAQVIYGKLKKYCELLQDVIRRFKITNTQ